jgi:hypothetical protein
MAYCICHTVCLIVNTKVDWQIEIVDGMSESANLHYVAIEDECSIEKSENAMQGARMQHV